MRQGSVSMHAWHCKQSAQDKLTPLSHFVFALCCQCHHVALHPCQVLMLSGSGAFLRVRLLTPHPRSHNSHCSSPLVRAAQLLLFGQIGKGCGRHGAAITVVSNSNPVQADAMHASDAMSCCNSRRIWLLCLHLLYITYRHVGLSFESRKSCYACLPARGDGHQAVECSLMLGFFGAVVCIRYGSC